MNFHCILPLDPPTPNSRMHWGQRARLTAHIRRDVAIQARSARNLANLPAADGHRDVHLALIRPGRRGAHPLDSDNLAGALKAVRDALIDSGWVTGDSPDAATFTYSQEKGGALAVRVTV